MVNGIYAEELRHICPSEETGKLLISTWLYLDIFLYRVKPPLSEFSLFPDQEFSSLTNISHITILPDKLGQDRPQSVFY